MNVSYDALLRDKLGDPKVGDSLWRTVTNVGEGDAYAYGYALLSIDWATWRDFGSKEYSLVSARWAERMLRDRRLPGGTLETLFSNGSVCNGFRADVAAHPNITERLERDALRSRSGLVREALAGNAAISGDAVSVLRKSKSQEVIGNLLSNSSLDGETLRDLVGYARRIGMSERVIAARSCKNASMPVDVVLECGRDDFLRRYVLGSPVLQRGELVQLLLEGVDGRVDAAAAYAFVPESNADGRLIDWYVNMWCRNAGSLPRPFASAGVEHALAHPRAWSSTLERAYMCCGGGECGDGILKNILRSVSCPDWVKWDVLSRGNIGLIRIMVRDAASVPHGYARALADAGKWEEAVACPNAPSDVLVDAVEGVVNEYEWRDKETLRNMLTNVMTHENMPPEVRREYARWSHKSLWSVALDGFLGRM